MASVAAIASLLLLLGAVHVANALRDIRGDRLNRKGWVAVEGAVGRRGHVWLGACCLAGAAFGAWAATPPARATLLASFLLGAAYVSPGIELKRRAGWDLAANAVGYGGLAFLLGAQSSAPGPEGARALSFLLQSAPYVLGVASIALCTMLADRDGDEASGQRTAAVLLGETRGAACAAGLAWGCALAGFLTRDLLPLAWGTVSGLTLGLGKDRLRGRAAWNRAVILLQGLFLASLLPRAWLPLVWAVVWGIASSIYYRARFGVAYPVEALRGAGGGTAI